MPNDDSHAPRDHKNTDPAIVDGVVEHYDRPGLLAAIESGFAEAGRPTGELTLADLAPVDEFHVGARPATESFLARLALDQEMTVLDVGCGLGGPARYAAATFGCRMVGVDPTEAYVEAARALTGWVGLDDRVTFRCATTRELTESDDNRFDAAYLMHVGMNVADKTAFFAEIGTLLEPGATLGVYDLMRTDDGDLDYPMPWATTAGTSFVATQVAYEASLASAGFEIVSAAERHDLANVFVDTVGRAVAAGRGPAGPVGLHLVMGPTIGAKVGNLTRALQAEVVTPVELLARRSSAAG